jgi:hypothetical protein
MYFVHALMKCLVDNLDLTFFLHDLDLPFDTNNSAHQLSSDIQQAISVPISPKLSPANIG